MNSMKVFCTKLAVACLTSLVAYDMIASIFNSTVHFLEKCYCHQMALTFHLGSERSNGINYQSSH